MSRTGHRIYEVDGIMVADPTQPITGDDTGTTPGAPLLSGGSGGVVLDWATATAYKTGQSVTWSRWTWIATNDHTSGATFLGDQAAHWKVLSGATADGRSPYLGPVATRGRLPTGRVASTIYKQMMGWSRHVATDDIDAIALLYSTINGVGEVANVAGPGTIHCSVEYPAGTITDIDTVTVPANDHVLTVLRTLLTRIPAGAAFWIGTWVNWTGSQGAVMADSFVSGVATDMAVSATRETVKASSTTVTDQTLTGTRDTPAGINARDSYRPTAILGMTTKPTFFLAGDSRTRAGLSWDLNADADGIQGLTERIVAPEFGYINAGVGTDTYANATSATGNNYAKRLLLAAYCSHVLDDYGINSVFADTSAAHQALVATFRAKFPGKPYFKTTLIPEITQASAAILADGSDQTPYGTLSLFVANNNWVRSGGGGVINGFIDLEDVVTLRRDSAKFRGAERVVTDAAMTSGSNVLTSATMNATTADLGKGVQVMGAEASGAVLKTAVIAVINSPTSVQLVQGNQNGNPYNAATTVSGATAGIGVMTNDYVHQTRQLERLIRDSAGVRRALAGVK